MTCETQNEILQSLLSLIDLNKFSILKLRVFPSHQKAMKDLEELFTDNSLDEMYKKWHLIKEILPAVSDRKILEEFIEETGLVIAEVNHKIEYIKVIYNDQMFREFDLIYTNKYGISVYDKMCCHFEDYKNLLNYVRIKVETRINEIGSENDEIRNLPISLKFDSKQTDAVCLFLLAENIGLFYDPEGQKPLNKIFSGAQFRKGNGFETAAALPSIISRIRRGATNRSNRDLDRKFKKKLIAAAEKLIDDFQNNKTAIYNKST